MIAVDTNVLIYACDQADAKRQKVALDLITNAQDGVLLWQVGCEFISASRKLHKQGFTSTHAWNRLAEFRDPASGSAHRRHPGPRQGTSSRAESVARDALILAACVEAGVDTSTLRTCRASMISRACASSTPSSNHRHMGAEEGDAAPVRGWPPFTDSGLGSRVPRR